MIVAVPYVAGMLHPRVVPAIERQGWHPELLECEPSYQTILERLFARMIENNRSLTVVEQDVESRIGTIDAFASCAGVYCFNAYRFNGSFADAGIDFAPLGHTRFRPEVAPHLLKLAQTEDWRVSSYKGLDQMIGYHLRTWGVLPHRHEGDVVHHHDYAK